MSNQQPDDAQLTVGSCVAKCIALDFEVAGMEYGVQCFCGNYLRNGAVLAASDSQCAMSCPGNSAEKCGDGNRLSVYHTGDGHRKHKDSALVRPFGSGKQSRSLSLRLC